MTPPACIYLLPGATSADLAWAVSGAPAGTWIKVCDASLIQQAQLNGASVLYRPYLPDDGDCQDGAAWGRQVLGALGGRQPRAIGYRNECSATAEQAAQYVRYRQALRDGGYRGLVVLGSFSTGMPGWSQYAALLAVRPDALELHEYWDLSVAGSAPWWALRHVEAIRRGLLSASLPLFIGECGSDRIPGGDAPSVEDAPANRRGWNDRGKLSADQESATIRAYLAGCAPSVVAAFVFGDGGSNRQWDSYRTRGTPVEDAIRATWTAVPPPPPPVPKGPPPMPVDQIPELDQGWTKACWAYAVAECFDASGHYVSALDIYTQVKGKLLTPPGDAATFAELRAAINAAAAMTQARVRWFGPLGVCNDPQTFDQLVGDGWYVIAGVAEQDLQPGQQYGHYVIARRIEWLNGQPYVDLVDSYRAEDGGSDRYALSQFHTAMSDNWDQAVDALAFQIVS